MGRTLLSDAFDLDFVLALALILNFNLGFNLDSPWISAFTDSALIFARNPVKPPNPSLSAYPADSQPEIISANMSQSPIAA